MVELSLETSEHGLPKDCYLSIRVGEVQKLSRLSGTRSFKFPQSTKSRFGKIEVFRRIGSASVDLDPDLAVGQRDISIDIDGLVKERVPLKVAVSAHGATKPTPEEPVKHSEKARAAKEYLGRHQLETKLADAMQAVLRERPDDPVAFLVGKLAKVAGQPPLPLKAAAAAVAAAPLGPAAILPFGAYFRTHFRSVGPADMEKAYARFLATRAIAPVAAAPPQKLALAPFAEYHRQAFRSVAPSDMAKVYQRFLAFAESSKKAGGGSGALPLAPFARYHQVAFKTVAPSDMAKVYQRFIAFAESSKKAGGGSGPLPLAPFARYHQVAFRTVAPSDMAKVYQRFSAYSEVLKKTGGGSGPLPLAPFARYHQVAFKTVGTSDMAKVYQRFSAYSEVLKKTGGGSGPLPLAPFARYHQVAFRTVGPSDMAKVYQRFPAFAESSKKAGGGSGPLALAPFARYHQVAFRTVGPSDMAKVYQRFPAFAESSKKADGGSGPLALAPFARYHQVAFRTVAPSDMAKVYQRFPAFAESSKKSGGCSGPLPLAPFARYHQVAFKTVAPSDMAKVYQRFPEYNQSLEQAQKAAVAAPAERSRPRLLPSVCTWVAQRPAAMPRSRVDVVRCLRGLQGDGVTPDQRREAERVLTNALLEMAGEFAGEYHPLATSDSFPSMPGGMSAEEERVLRSRSLLFTPKTGDAAGRGVFVNRAQDMAAWVNESDRVRFVVFHTGPAAETRLRRFQQAVEAALRQDGYTLV